MLESTLEAIERINIPEETEIIIVDNNSSDNTSKIINAFLERLPIRYVFEKNQGISAAKNTGIHTASGNLIVFTDDDVRPCTDWLTTYWDNYRNESNKRFYGGPVVSEFSGQIPDERIIKIAPPSVKGLDLGKNKRIIENTEWFVSANFAIPLQAITDVGGFNEELGLGAKSKIALIGEETDLQRRMRSVGYCGIYIPSAYIHHIVPNRKCTLEHIAIRAEAWGKYLRRITPVEHSMKTLLGVPLWRYRKCYERRIRAWTKRINGLDWYQDYIAYRVDLGFIKGSFPKR